MTNPARTTLVASLLMCCLAAPAAAETGLLGPMFQDHAVLQRDRPIEISGEARPNETVEIRLGDAVGRARADRAGAWRVKLPAMPAGGPFTLSATTRSGASATAQDVMIGDVWLCSGQSNMEWPVSLALNPEGEAATATDRLRLFTVPRSAQAAPQKSFAAPAAWTPASAESAAKFSAVCFFFARELQKTIDVPMGLVHSSWGGSRIEPWIDAANLKRLGGHDEALALLSIYAKNPVDAQAPMGRMWETWWRAAAPGAGEPWTGAGEWTAVPGALRDWKKWGVPELAAHDGMLWYRRAVTLTAEQAAQPATLTLGRIDEIDQTWVNGRVIGRTFGWGDRRTYALPAGALKPGVNEIVVNVYSGWSEGGLVGPDDAVALTFPDGDRVSLAGDWGYRRAPAQIGDPPRAPWESISGTTSLSNGMIAPIGRYPMRGALWYQGESNAGEAQTYAPLLTTLMTDWRARFGEDLSFFVVQLADFGSRPTRAGTVGWGAIRDAQRRAVEADSNAGLAVTIDLGEPDDIHPPNKQAVGRRLARAARHVVYGEAITPSGPRAIDAVATPAGVRVRFTDIDGGLVAVSGEGPNAFELCGESGGDCRWAIAKIDGESVLLPPADGAQLVRYCFGDAPLCTLYDGAGLPAGPFQLKIKAQP